MKPTDWFKDAIIYHVFIDRFSRGKKKDGRQKKCKGPVFCGGNLQGVIDRLDYLKELGVNTIWLSPFNKASAYHGYHVTDFYDVDSHFGSVKTVRTLIKSAHKKGIRVIMCFVPNHVSYKHPYFLDAQKNKNSKYRDWFYFTKWPNDYLCYLHFPELPKLNLDYAPARNHVIKAAKYWLDQGIDGFRLDHVAGPSHGFWKAFHNAVKKHKLSAVLIGEAGLLNVKWHHVKTLKMKHKHLIFLSSFHDFKRTRLAMRQYTGIFDGVFDFEFQRLLRNFIARGKWYKPLWLLKWKLKRHYNSFPKNFFLPSFLDNHDSDRFLFEAGQNKERLKQAAAIQFAQTQPLIIYYGTEVGLSQRKAIKEYDAHGDLEVRRMMPWTKQDKRLLRFYKELIRQRTSRKAQ